MNYYYAIALFFSFIVQAVQSEVNTNYQIEISEDYKSAIEQNYRIRFWNFLETEEFSDLIIAQEDVAQENGYNKTFYISGYLRGFMESSCMNNLINTVVAQGEDRFHTIWEFRSHENFGYLVGKKAGNLFGNEIVEKLRSESYEVLQQFIRDFNNSLGRVNK